MPWYSFKEIWTPLALVGIRFYRETDDREIWIKVWNRSRRPLRRRA